MSFDEKNMLTEKEVSEYVGISRSSLRVARLNTKSKKDKMNGPPFHKMGRAIRYLKSDVDAWIMQNRVDPNKEELK
jgi:predicted DNA-binding transcriptional regulator AlpA